MKATIKAFLPLFFFLIFVNVSYSTVYEELGYYANYFSYGHTSVFDSDFRLEEDGTLSAKSFSSELLSNPIVSDLDGDGTKEIIVYTPTGLYAYQNTTLDLVDSYPLTDDGYNIVSNLLAFDVNGDGTKEIVFAKDDVDIMFFNFNGSDLVSEENLTFADNCNYCQIMLNCRESDECMVIYTDRYTANADIQIYARHFNMSGVGAETTIKTASDVDAKHEYCLPDTRTPVVVDLDYDSSKEFVFNYGYFSAESDDEGFYIMVLNMLETPPFTISDQKQITVYEAAIYNGGNLNCYQTGNYMINKLSNVIVGDFADSYGLEMAVGYGVDEDNYKMNLYDYNGNLIETCPEGIGSNYDGETLSNLVYGVFFPLGRAQGCMFGYIDGDYTTVSCISNNVCVEAFIEETDFVNYSDSNTGEYKNTNWGLIHGLAAETDYNVLKDSPSITTNTMEIVSNYGIYKTEEITDSLYYESWEGEVTLVYSPSFGQNSSIYPANVGAGDYVDLIALRGGTEGDYLSYLDDGYDNAPGQLYAINTSPCYTDPWKVNTSIQAKVTPYDYENDYLQAKIYLYYGSQYEYNTTWTGNVSSLTPITFSLEPNTTISNSIMRVCVRDDVNPTTEDCANLPISVTLDGKIYGDSYCGRTFSLVDPEGNEIDSGGDIISTTVTGEDAITNTLETINEIFSLSLPLKALALFIMIIVSITIWIAGGGSSFTFGMIGLFNFLAVMIGVYLGIFSWSLIFIFVIFSAAIVGLYLGRLFTNV